MRLTKKTCLLTLMVLGFAGMAGIAGGQVVGPFSAFPSGQIDDGRFLSLVSGLDGLTGERPSIGLSVPAGAAKAAD